MGNQCTAIGLFQDFLQVQAAVRALRSRGFDPDALSIIGKNHHTDEHVTGFVDAGDGIRYWGRFGGIKTSLSGSCRRSAVLQFPGTGQVVVFGPLVQTLVGALGARGEQALAETFAALGFPPQQVQQCDSAVRRGRLAVLVQGTREQVQAAQQVLRTAGAVDPAAIQSRKTFP